MTSPPNPLSGTGRGRGGAILAYYVGKQKFTPLSKLERGWG